MKLFTIFLIFIAHSHATRLDNNVQSIVKWSRKIVGGSEAPRDEFLYKCALYIYRTVEDDFNFCSGSIISESFVLSAAHCFEHMSSGLLVAGVHNLQEEEAPHDWEFEPQDVIVHEMYDAAANLNDIALINATAYPFAFISNAIQKIELAFEGISIDNLVGTLARVAGWGQTTDTNLEISSSLMYIESEIIDSDSCRRVYGKKVRDTNICLSGDDGQSTCQGDSGGGLEVFYEGRTVLVGIVSFGAEAGCEKNYPIVFTFIPPYYEWIISTVNNFNSMLIKVQ